jgi:hypothetical protein
MGSHIISSQDDDDGIIAGAIKLLWEIGLFISRFLCLPAAEREPSAFFVYLYTWVYRKMWAHYQN